jgi:hypothetical protein
MSLVDEGMVEMKTQGGRGIASGCAFPAQHIRAGTASARLRSGRRGTAQAETRRVRECSVTADLTGIPLHRRDETGRAQYTMPVSTPRFDTSLLDRALDQNQERREALRGDTIASLRNALAATPVRYSAVYLFGSVLQPGRFREDSDVDVAFEGLSDEDYFRAKRYLENTLRRPVDVLQLEEHRLRNVICRKGVRWTRDDIA